MYDFEKKYGDYTTGTEAYEAMEKYRRDYLGLDEKDDYLLTPYGEDSATETGKFNTRLTEAMQPTGGGGDTLRTVYSQTIPEVEPIGTKTTTKVEFGGTAPVMGQLPELKISPYSEKRVEALTQRYAAPKISQLRQAVQQMTSQAYENPNVKKMALRQALAGLGTGIAEVTAGARREAGAEYARRRAEEVRAAELEYQTQYQKMIAEYNAALQEYFADVQKTTEKELIYPEETGGIS